MAGISALSRDRVGFVGEIAEIGYRAVEHAVADKGRSALGRWSTSRGCAAHQVIEGRRAAPAVLLSTIT
jgi:hypothetical protein